MSTSSKSAAGAVLNAYGVIRLSDADDLMDSLGEQCFELYLDEFELRLSKALRPVD